MLSIKLSWLLREKKWEKALQGINIGKCKETTYCRSCNS